jgi:hypothetical protein
MPFPFLEPASPLAADARRHGPSGYSDYASYKPWLRDEHDFRCVYCLTREAWDTSGAFPSNGFGADHMLSQFDVPAKTTDYNNLCYCCNDCNSRKGKRSLPQRLIDQPLAQHLRIRDDGTVVCLTNEGLWLRDCMQLDVAEQTQCRRDILELKRRAEADLSLGLRTVLMTLFEFPRHLPNLSELRPYANTRVEGLEESAWARRNRGELEQFY